MSDHGFHVKTFMTSFITLMALSGLVFGSWFDLSQPECAFERDGRTLLFHQQRNMSLMGEISQQERIYNSGFGIKCHLLDILIWVYVVGYVIFMCMRYSDYYNATPADKTARVSYLYFMCDYCYLHNTVACLLLMSLCIDARWVETGDPVGSLGSFWKKPIAPSEAQTRGFPLIGGIRVGLVPIGVGIAELQSTPTSSPSWLSPALGRIPIPSARKIAIFTFAALLGGNAAILFAILIWSNALVLHDKDKLVSLWIHLAVPTVQALMLHSAMMSLKARERSESRELLRASIRFDWLLMSHYAMFALWQLLSQGFIAWRTWRRQGKEEDGVVRIDAFKWMMEKPPGGKDGLLYKMATVLGLGAGARVMFVVIQAGMHFVFLSVGYLVIKLSVWLWDAWPLLAFVFVFLLISVRNGALLMKRWITRLQQATAAGARAGSAASAEDGKKQKAA